MSLFQKIVKEDLSDLLHKFQTLYAVINADSNDQKIKFNESDNTPEKAVYSYLSKIKGYDEYKILNSQWGKIKDRKVLLYDASIRKLEGTSGVFTGDKKLSHKEYILSELVKKLNCLLTIINPNNNEADRKRVYSSVFAIIKSNIAKYIPSNYKHYIITNPNNFSSNYADKEDFISGVRDYVQILEYDFQNSPDDFSKSFKTFLKAVNTDLHNPKFRVTNDYGDGDEGVILLEVVKKK